MQYACVRAHMQVQSRHRKTDMTQCGFLCSNSRALGEAVNKRFSVSPKWEVSLQIRRAGELTRTAGERESIELEGPLWVSTKVAVE